MKIIGDASKARMIAVFIDHIIAFALMMLTVALVPESFPAVKAVLFFFTYLAYYVVLEALWSRTPGKFLQGLVVRKLDGSRCDWPAAVIRGSLRIVEVNPLLLGGLPAGLVIIATERKQRIGDLLAGTVVVSNKLIWTADSIDSTTEQGLVADPQIE
ncbi:MAG TPA: RDD family protein [Pyrinomonadaceae bacterium]|nr:RDD family protein [Pyrinomonadaceae bacterium]